MSNHAENFRSML